MKKEKKEEKRSRRSRLNSLPLQGDSKPRLKCRSRVYFQRKSSCKNLHCYETLVKSEQGR